MREDREILMKIEGKNNEHKRTKDTKEHESFLHIKLCVALL